MTAQSFKDPWPKAHPIEAYQDEINAREKLARDRHDFEQNFYRLKEWGDHIWLENHLTDMLTELMGK